MASIALDQPRGKLGLRLRFTVAIFAGSFLLFLVQPMLARMALPRLGGAPAVWNSAMLVYQALLLAGYAYAHAVARLPGRTQAAIHLAALAVAALTLPLGLSAAVPDASDNSFLWVPWLLLLSVGPLFFVISAQAPLLQRWFAMSGGGDPYPLYAASNFGSLLGLLAYPLLLEPLMGVGNQSWWWSLGYAVMALLVGGCMLTLRGSDGAGVPAVVDDPHAQPIAWKRISRWILLAAVPSGLMLSTTLHLTTDIAAMPLLWVVPLAVYLLSFTVAFSERRGLARLCARLAPFTLLAVCAGLFRAQGALLLPMMMMALLNLFLVAVALHSMLFDDRPAPSQLTGFYLAMSIGGALGGLFCALIAPLLFDWTYEHPILLLAAGVLVGGLPPLLKLQGLSRPGAARRLLMLVCLILVILLSWEPWLGEQPAWVRLPLLTALMGIAVLSIGRRWLFATCLAVLMITMGGIEKLSLSVAPGQMTRSYFGVYSVEDGRDQRFLFHGTTIHGIQNRGSVARERMPTSYYAPKSGVGRVMAATPTLYGPRARIDAVGLGTGTLSCYARPEERWTFYEIDPAVVSIAQDPQRFTFLSRCLPGGEMVVGDARLSLARKGSASSDLLIVDAFTSDAVPMHLLTREAFALYRRVLQPEGLLLVHITNRHLDLEPVVAAAARQGLHGLVGIYNPGAGERLAAAAPSRWIALSASPSKLRQVQAETGTDFWRPLRQSKEFGGWTDDYGSILPLLKR